MEIKSFAEYSRTRNANNLFYQKERITLGSNLSTTNVRLDPNYSYLVGVIFFVNLDDIGIIQLTKEGRNLVPKLPAEFFRNSSETPFLETIFQLNETTVGDIVNLTIDKNGSPSMDSIDVIFILSNEPNSDFVERKFDYNEIDVLANSTVNQKLDIINEARKLKAIYISASYVNFFSIRDNSRIYIPDTLLSHFMKDRSKNSIYDLLVKIDIQGREIFTTLENNNNFNDDKVFVIYEYEV